MPGVPGAADRLLLRLVCALACRQVREVSGLARVLRDRDPFVLAANHVSRREAVYLPALLMLARGGHPVRFLADWNFRLIPGVGYLYDRTGAITVTRKPARPAFLNRFKHRYLGGPGAFDQARAALAMGQSVALFPEGTVNRRSDARLRARHGAVRLAQEGRAPLIPLGIRLARARPDGRFDSGSPMSLRFGGPIDLASEGGTLEGHGRRLMETIEALSGRETRIAATHRSQPAISRPATDPPEAPC